MIFQKITLNLNTPKLSTLLRNSGIYTITSILNGIIPFLVLPIITRFLSPEDYGTFSMFTLLVSIFSIFTGLSIHGAISIAYFERNLIFKKYVFNCIAILLVSSLVTLVIVTIFAEPIASISTVPASWTKFAVVVSFFEFIISITLSIYQVRTLAKKYAILQILRSLLSAILSIFLIIIVGLKWEGRVLGQSITTIIVGLTGLVILRKWMEWKFSFQYIKHALAFGIPLIPHSLGGMLMTYTDRLIISHTLGIEATGIYVAGWQIGSIISILAEAFNKAYSPWLFSALSNNNLSEKSKLVNFTYLYFLAALTSSLLFGLISPFTTTILLGKDFYNASPIIFWTAIGGAFTGMYYMIVNYIFYAQKTYILAFITFTCGAFNLIATYLFTINYGLIGASYAYVITCFFQFLLSWIWSSRVYKMPWTKFIGTKE